jgi:hypothetical protein
MAMGRTGTFVFSLFLMITLGLQPSIAQSNQNSARPAASATASGRADAQASSRVSAEMVKGKLNPATSKPGDEVAVRLQDDVKSNGEVILKKAPRSTASFGTSNGPKRRPRLRARARLRRLLSR